MRRYRRRWKVERTFAWLGNFRRLVVRWDRSLTIYRAFFYIACLIIALSSYETGSSDCTVNAIIGDMADASTPLY